MTERPAVAVPTVLGTFGAVFGDRGLRRLLFPETAARLPVAPAPGPEAGVLGEELNAYLAGRLREFSVPLELHGTAFQLAVWEALRAIPFGATTTYAALARALARPAAVRAVGAANGANPVPILVPCHRVIGSSGALTGYGGGLELKRRLLALEGALLA